MRAEQGEVYIGAHGYQPIRKAPVFAEVSTSLTTVDWTKRATSDCYQPLATYGIFDLPFSLAMFPVLLEHLHGSVPDIIPAIHRSLRENRIGTPFVHAILPDVSPKDAFLLLEAGRLYQEKLVGKAPVILWVPESAWDNNTLAAAVQCGYRAFICDPQQIKREDGRSADNMPVIIRLSHGQHIVGLPYHHRIKNGLAFGDRTNADRFVDNIILPNLTNGGIGRRGLGWTDLETFGHHDHDPFAYKFLDYLLTTALPTKGIIPVRLINLVEQVEERVSALPRARLIERRAWSCQHEDLARWHGPCGCGGGRDDRWKQPFYLTFSRLNENVSEILSLQLPDHCLENLARNFSDYLAGPAYWWGPAEKLLAAKASSLVARTSCGTFFGDIYTSGLINILFGWQAVCFLTEAGLSKMAEEVEQQFLTDLAQVKVRRHDQVITGVDILQQMFTQTS